MFVSLFSAFLLNIFAFFNLFGIRRDLVVNQLLFFLIAVVVFVVVKKLGMNFFKANSKFFYWLFIALLVITFIIGIEVKGSRRWINLFFFNFQPSEFFKIFFIIFLADFFTRHRKELGELIIYLKSLGYLFLPLLIIFKQPDLGNALIFFFIYLVIALYSNLPKRYLIYTVLIAILIIPVGWFTLKDYQKNRIVSFLNPEIDQQGINYNLTQAIITVGSGKFFGRGLGYGTQTKLYFLPENHTDFAFSSLIEQFGFLGGASVLVLYFAIFFNLLKKLTAYFISDDEDSQFKKFFILGFCAYFIFQVLINVGMNLGILPIAGVALPLLSYGGSSLVSFLLGLALIL